MSAINLSFNPNLVYQIFENKSIILKNIEDDKLVYDFRIPKDFHLYGPFIQYHGLPTYVATPYKLNKPEYIPEGYKDLKITLSGTWSATNDKGREIYYINTTILEVEDFEYVSLGKFKIGRDEIPKPFWVSRTHVIEGSYIHSWTKVSEIQKKVSLFDEKSRLIREEELMSIFAFNEKGMRFWREIRRDFYDSVFFKDLERFFVCANEIDMDNWYMVVSSRENRNLYRLLSHEKSDNHMENNWCVNRCMFWTDDGKNHPFHVYSVFSSEDNSGPKLVKKI